MALSAGNGLRASIGSSHRRNAPTCPLARRPRANQLQGCLQARRHALAPQQTAQGNSRPGAVQACQAPVSIGVQDFRMDSRWQDCTAGEAGRRCREGYGLADDPHLRPIVGELLTALQAHNIMTGGGHAFPLCGGAGGCGRRGERVRGTPVRALHGQKLQDSFDHGNLTIFVLVMQGRGPPRRIASPRRESFTRSRRCWPRTIRSPKSSRSCH